MNELQQELFEKQLHSLAKRFDYPRTPDVAGSVMRRLRGFPASTRAERRVSEAEAGRGGRGEGKPRFLSRRFAWSLTIILVLLTSLMLIPPARAAILQFIQIGV